MTDDTYTLSLDREATIYLHRMVALGGMLVALQADQIPDLAQRVAVERLKLELDPEAYYTVHERLCSVILGQIPELYK